MVILIGLLILMLLFFMLIPTGGLYLWFRMVMWLMGRQHSVREKTGLLYYFFVFLGGLGFIGDCLYNWTFGTIIFAQYPTTLTLSTRIGNIRKHNETGWRRELADYICVRVLNPISNRYGMGDHC